MKPEEEIFEGAELKGKRFPFKQLTVTQNAKMNKKLFTPGFWRLMFNGFASVLRNEDTEKRMWKQIRSVAFEKKGLWRIGIVPKELRCSVIRFEEAARIGADFFKYAGVKAKEQSVPSNSASSSQIKSNKGLSKDSQNSTTDTITIE
jgi:hypothetical protein